MHWEQPFWPSWVGLHLVQDMALARASSRSAGPGSLALALALAFAWALRLVMTGTEYWLLIFSSHSFSLWVIWWSVGGGLGGSPR